MQQAEPKPVKGTIAPPAPAQAVDLVTGEVFDEAPPLEPDAPDPGVISEPQRKRFFAIAKETGWSTDDVRAMLLKCDIHSSKDILRSQYDDLISALQAGPIGDGQGAIL